jgi:hypothetical protein
VLALAADQPEGRNVPERGGPAVAQDDLVALRQVEQRTGPTVFFTGAWRCDVPISDVPVAARASRCEVWILEGPAPNRPSAGLRLSGIWIASFTWMSSRG